MNEETDRLNMAEEYLLTFPSGSQEFDAALDHVMWVRSGKPELLPRCNQILETVGRRRRDETETMSKLLKAVK